MTMKPTDCAGKGRAPILVVAATAVLVLERALAIPAPAVAAQVVPVTIQAVAIPMAPAEAEAVLEPALTVAVPVASGVLVDPQDGAFLPRLACLVVKVNPDP